MKEEPSNITNIAQSTSRTMEEAPVSEITADPEVGGVPDIVRPFPPEYESRRRSHPPSATCISARDQFLKNMAERPWQRDEDEPDVQLVRAPPAAASRATTEGRLPRTCWIHLQRAWLKSNFLKHLIGAGNIRYRNVTYASLCHHPSTSWDTHPMCWQCYIELDLPKCGVDSNILCPYCDLMGREATRLRRPR